MDARTFDRWTLALADRPSRRVVLRLLAGGLLGGLLARTTATPAGARQERPDRDGDGLFDDDEVAVYGTNPDLFDTDNDGTGDGEEVFNGTDPLDGGIVVGPAPHACAPIGQSCAALPCCDGQPCNAGFCGTCKPVGARCNADADCCPGGVCCFNGTSLTTVCTDVAATGGVCPGEAPPVPKATCRMDQEFCGGACVDILRDINHCGACFASCPLGGVCDWGICCGAGRVNCGGRCVDPQTDYANCGACNTFCDSGVCAGGTCAPVCSGPGSLCLSGSECCSGDCIGFCV